MRHFRCATSRTKCITGWLEYFDDKKYLNSGYLFTARDRPRHYSAWLDSQDFQLQYKEIFGGTVAFTPESFEKINGFSNQFWGWGGEPTIHHMVNSKIGQKTCGEILTPTNAFLIESLWSINKNLDYYLPYGSSFHGLCRFIEYI